MAELAVNAVVTRIASAIAAVAGWEQSAYPYDLFGASLGEGSRFAHQVFAVGASDTTWVSPVESSLTRRGSTGGGGGGLVVTTIGIRWLYRLRSDAYVADYAAMLTAEAELYKTVLVISRADLHVALVRMQRRVVTPEAGDWCLGDLQVAAQHRIALT